MPASLRQPRMMSAILRCDDAASDGSGQCRAVPGSAPPPPAEAVGLDEGRRQSTLGAGRSSGGKQERVRGLIRKSSTIRESSTPA
ncbi:MULTISPECIES: hypothetical protein [unclassified Actinomadura]|uniref:hypothetical protein n=1 Tax=unclassified Actinomadura TaxID=2626254 RepID=UPI0011EE262D|nr:hypothetical protein [Actinomadura sp. K4S16]